MEVEKQIVNLGQQTNDKIEAGLRAVASLIGHREPFAVPPIDDYRRAVIGRWRELDPMIVRMPFTLEHAKSALQRVMAELPPNGPKNQQFKDSAIWQAVLDLAQKYTTYLVSADTGYFKDKEHRRGLHDSLQTECQRLGVDVHLHDKLDTLLDTLRPTTPKLDYDAIAAAIRNTIEVAEYNAAAGRGYELGEAIKSNVKAYITEQVHELAVSFEITYRLFPTHPDVAMAQDATMLVTGTCSYDMQAGQLLSWEVDDEIFEWTDQDGQRRRAKNAYARVAHTARLVHYALRQQV